MSTLVVNQHTPVDATAGSVTMTLPTGKPAGSQLSVEKYDSTLNQVIVSGSIRGAASTVTLSLPHEIIAFRADAAGSWWPEYDHKTLGSLDARHASVSTARTAIYDDVTYKPDSAPAATGPSGRPQYQTPQTAKTLSGHPVTPYGNHTAAISLIDGRTADQMMLGRSPVIKGGWISRPGTPATVNPATGVVTGSQDTDIGCYYQVGPALNPITQQPQRLNYAAFSWRGFAGGWAGIVGCFAFMSADFASTAYTINGVPATPLHFLFTAPQLYWTKFPTTGGAPVNASPIWSPVQPYPFDGATVNDFKIYLDTENGWALVEDSRGGMYAWFDPDIVNIPVYYGYVEDFRGTTMRDDPMVFTAGSPVVADTSIGATDTHRDISGYAGIPAGTYVGTVTPGVGFRMSSSVLAQNDVNATAGDGVTPHQVKLGVVNQGAVEFQNVEVDTLARSRIVSAFQRFWARPLVDKTIVAPSGSDFSFQLTSTPSRPDQGNTDPCQLQPSAYPTTAGALATNGFICPPSRHVTITVEFFIEVTAVPPDGSGEIRVAILDSTGTILGYRKVAGSPSDSGSIRVTLPHSLAEPVGSVVTRSIAWYEVNGVYTTAVLACSNTTPIRITVTADTR